MDRPEEVAISSMSEEAWFIAAQWQKEQCLGLWQRVFLGSWMPPGTCGGHLQNLDNGTAHALWSWYHSETKGFNHLVHISWFRV